LKKKKVKGDEGKWCHDRVVSRKKEEKKGGKES